MTNETITTMINKQIGKELYSSYLYLKMANYYEDEGLDGFANWFEIQAKEELDHAMLFRKFLINNGAHVCLATVEAPADEFSVLEEPLTASLAHEQMVTASISAIYAEALSSKDYKTTQFLDWFLMEQGEEEKKADDLCKKYKLFCKDAKGLYLLNAEMMTRVYAAPSLVL